MVDTVSHFTVCEYFKGQSTSAVYALFTLSLRSGYRWKGGVWELYVCLRSGYQSVTSSVNSQISRKYNGFGVFTFAVTISRNPRPRDLQLRVYVQFTLCLRSVYVCLHSVYTRLTLLQVS